jgi:hypothetical protein
MHHFHGNYTATVVLAPDEKEDVPLILATFVKLGFAFGMTNGGGGIYLNGTSDDIDRLKGAFAAFSLCMKPCGYKHCGKKRCKAKEIDACEHSVDYGPEFEISVPVELDTSMTLGLPGVT